MERRTQLSEDTRRVYAFVCDYVRTYMGRPPTHREIAEGCFMARSTIQRHLDILDARGLIIREPGVARGISLPQDAPP